MGLLVNGEWHDKWYDTKKSGGRFQREDSVFRNWVTKDGSPGPTGQGGFKAEAGSREALLTELFTKPQDWLGDASLEDRCRPHGAIN